MEKRKGNQSPTAGFTLTGENTDSLDEEAVGYYEKTGRTALPWQKNVLHHMMAVNDDGLWLHSRFGFSVPRQNGKNEVIAIREMYGLMCGERILHTAHRTSTTHTAWERLLLLLEKAGIQADSTFRAFGKEHIYIGEGRIEFRTRTSVGGLGETFDTLIIDEAQEYQDDQESALKYTIVSSDNPQTIYLGTPPTPYSSGTIFPKLRLSILTGAKRNSGWLEWGVEEESSVWDTDLWYRTNPSLGYKLTERAIEDEIGDDTVDFNIQRLGLWIRYNQKSAISKTDWECCRVDTLPKIRGRLAVGVKYNKDGGHVSLAIAGRADGHIFVEAVGCHSTREGNGWIVEFLAALGDNAIKTVVDGANGQSLLESEAKKSGIKKIYLPKIHDIIVANAQFEQNVFSRTLQHMGQPALVDIVTNCEKRAIGSAGGFGYRSIKLGADVSIMDAVILAQWALGEFKQEPKKQKIYY